MVDVTVVDLVERSFVRREPWPLYRSVFGDFDDPETWLERVWDPHSARSGFRLALARDGQSLVGFAYGCTGQPGRWWTDTAATVLDPAVAAVAIGQHGRRWVTQGPDRVPSV